MEILVMILGIMLVLCVLTIIRLVEIITSHNKTIETIRNLWQNDKDVETLRLRKKEIEFWEDLAHDLGYFIDPDLNKFNEFYKNRLWKNKK